MDGLHPVLVARVRKVIDAMAQSGHPVFVTEGVRSSTRQQQLFALGRTVKGRKVTNADGLTKRSNHQVKADGYGHAVDLAFVGPEPFAEDHPWDLLGAIVQDHALVWGGSFTSFPDRPHVELPSNIDEPGALITNHSQRA
jgi:peptidoglycan L-alanyl-D-glutamate endopeptidase CwlK